MEWILAAVWANYTLEQFERLDAGRQALIVAAYRVQHQIEAVLNEHQKMQMEREALLRELQTRNSTGWR